MDGSTSPLRFVPALALGLVVATSAPAQNENAGTNAAAARRDLLSVARAEAARERAAIDAQVVKLLDELKATTETNHSFITTRIDALVAFGPAAIPLLVSAMDHEDPTQGAQNAGTNAARAAARIPGQPVVNELTRVAKSGGKFGRKNVARCIGWRGDPVLLPILKELLANEDTDIQREGLLAVGMVGGKDAPELLRPFYEDTNAALASAAIHSAAQIADASSARALEQRLRAEISSPPTARDDRVLAALIEYFSAVPDPAVFDALDDVLRVTDTPVQVRIAAIDALAELALSQEGSKARVIDALRLATKAGLKSIVKAAALAMLRLGDPSGADDVTQDLDQEISRNKNNFNARYKRAEIYLDFYRYKDAQRDFSEGLRIEKDPRDPERVFVGIARAYAGMGRFSDAAKYLRKLPDRDFSDLPSLYSEFQGMASDPRYGAILKPK